MADYLIANLSDHLDALLNYEDIAVRLTDEQHSRIVEYVRACHTMSFRKVRGRYDHWKEADRAHDCYVPADSTDFREKAVIPDTRAITDTVLTYMMAALAGRNPMFQLEGLNRKSRKQAMILERILHQGMRRTAGEARIAQLLLDSIRYGFAPTKCLWLPNRNQNFISNFDPRRAFPDPRVTWGDWERMQFIVFSDTTSYAELYASGQYPYVNEHPELREERASRGTWEGHDWHKEAGRGLSIDPNDNTQGTGHFSLGNNRWVDEAWLRVGGYEIGADQIHSLWLECTVLDEKKVVSLRLNPYGRQFPTVIGGMFFDTHKTYSESLYDLMLPLHDIATWLLRSRVDNVQAALNNLIFVDPLQVSIPDLIDRNPWGVVRMSPGAKAGDGVYVAAIPDVTRGHWNDIAALSDMKQRLSAASDAQQGIPTPDVRTATEIQRLTQLGSQRLGMMSRVFSATTLRPLVRMMTSNIQDALSHSGSVRMSEDQVPGALAGSVQDGYLDYDVQDLQGEIDYLVIDGTLPLEPSRDANSWMSVLQVLNQTGMIMEFRADKIVEEAIRAMGVTDIDQYRIGKEEQGQGAKPHQQLALMEKSRGASVQPNEQVQKEVEKGNLVSIGSRR
jgi:hypothetical protein